MTLRRRRVRGVEELNEKLAPATPGSDFFRFVDVCNQISTDTDEWPLWDADAISMFRLRQPQMLNANLPVIDDPDAITGPDFYPIGWLHNLLFGHNERPLGGTLSEQQRKADEDEAIRIRVWALSHLGSDPMVMHAFFPYMHKDFGLVLVLGAGLPLVEIDDDFDFVLEASQDEVMFAVHNRNVFGLSNRVSMEYRAISIQHRRLAWLLATYKAAAGKWPDLYDQYLDALRAQENSITSSNRSR